MIKDGILRTIRIGAKHLIRKSDIEKQFKIAIQNEALHN